VFLASLVYLQVSNINNKNSLKILSIVPSIFVILASYQSGFIALMIALLIIILVFSDRTSKWSFEYTEIYNFIRSKISTLIYLLVAILICLFLSPETAKHLYNQSFNAYSAVAGWSMSLTNPFTLVGMPTNLDINNKPSFSNIIIFFGVIVYLLGRPQFKSINYLSVGFCILVLLFLFYFLFFHFNSRPNNYQIWKGSSYVLLPFGFLFFTMSINHYLKNVSLNKTFLLSALGVIISLVSFNHVSPMYFKGFDSQYKNLSTIRNEISRSFPTKNTVLLTDHWRDTFIALNLLSAVTKVYPINNTYIPHADINKLELDNHNIVAPSCDGSKNYALLDSYQESLFYQFGNNGCGMLANAIQFTGLYDSETQGRWSQEKKSSFIFNFDVFKKFKPKEIVFNISPYLPSSIRFQEVDIYLENKFYKTIKIHKDIHISFPVNNLSDIFHINFYIHKPLNPSNFGSSDNRDIALFFRDVYYKF
jgi:hypothetical protein